jgi:hypothetical protein
MNRLMLEHKKVIVNISENRKVFSNIIFNSYKWLKNDELIEFEQWIISNFWDSHQNEIQEIFNKYYSRQRA